MPNLKEVKERISSVNNTQQITNAMKLVAAAKLRKAQDAITRIKPYSQKMQEILANVADKVDPEEYENVYTAQREPNRILIVVITSDRGLCGGFNSAITKKTLGLLKGQYAEQNKAGNVQIMGIGKKGTEFFQKREMDVDDEHMSLFKNLNFITGRMTANAVIDKFKAAEVDEVVLVYNAFENVATQVVTAEPFLPIKPSELEEGEASNSKDYIFEPSVEFIVEDLIPKSLKIQFYKALLDSNASEHGARMTAMDKATENAGELLKDLKLMYNRTRQAAITKEILEIVGGANALGG